MFDLMKELDGASRIGIGGHVHPDGDCVGSVLGLYNYLIKNMPVDTVIDAYMERPSDVFDTVAGIGEIHETADEACDPYDVFFCLDCDHTRLGHAAPLFANAKKKINVDHHISNKGSGDVNYIDATAGSASELVFDLLDLQKMDENCAKALYIGIIHDTGVLQYSNTSPKTLRAVADLIGFGFDFSTLIEETFYQKSYAQTRVCGKAMFESVLLLDGKVAYTIVTRKTMEEYGLTAKDMDGIVNQIRNIKGVQCAVFLYEMSDTEFKVSMRSTDAVNAADIAVFFGGGGHKKAAGVTMEGSTDEIISRITERIAIQLTD
ncbi:MAG: DHH family phosphoesterase [Lachnospiraceae bacterium]|nr:DHH family phosphoesterase [Lachnospiraceae bacterium]